MSNLISYAESELDRIGLVDDGEMNGAMRKHILHMVREFSDEGHSGFSASYAINLLSRLMRYEPLTPLTGEDSEWNLIQDERTNGVSVYQNKRMSSVFKRTDRFDGKPYWMDGVVFWEWYSAPDIDGGKPYKTYFTSRESMVTIQFPWSKPDKPEYVFRPTDEFPNEVL